MIPRLVKALIVLMAVQVVAAGLDLAFPPDLTRARHASPVALDRKGQWLRALPVEDGRWRIKADLERTDPVIPALIPSPWSAQRPPQL